MLGVVIFCLGLFALPQVSHADILFIDLNCSSSEIAAAQAGANTRHEKLILLPKRTPEQQSAYCSFHELQMQQEASMFGAASMTPTTPAAQAAAQAALQKKMTDFAKKIAVAQQKINDLSTANPPPRFNMSDVGTLLSDYAKAHKKIETIVISGHHVGSYYGAFGGFQNSDLVSLFAQHPEAAKDLQSLYGWGCYSATTGQALSWEEAFPNLQMVGGFEGIAPGAGMKASGDFLTSLLTQEAQLSALSHQKEDAALMKNVANRVKALPGFDMTNAAVCTRAVCVGMKTGVTDFANMAKSCSDAYLNILQTEAREANAEFMWGFNTVDPPCNAGASPLRHYYSDLRAADHCQKTEGENALGFQMLEKSTEKIIRLIHMQDVAANFQLYYHDQIEKLASVDPSCVEVSSLYSTLKKAPACEPDKNDDSKYMKRSSVADLVRMSQSNALAGYGGYGGYGGGYGAGYNPYGNGAGMGAGGGIGNAGAMFQAAAANAAAAGGNAAGNANDANRAPANGAAAAPVAQAPAAPNNNGMGVGLGGMYGSPYGMGIPNANPSYSPSCPKMTGDQNEAFKKVSTALTGSILQLRPECIPPTWMDPATKASDLEAPSASCGEVARQDGVGSSL